jgi:biofilm PGA synthesis N-glycosyltransferase PgaC
MREATITAPAPLWSMTIGPSTQTIAAGASASYTSNVINPTTGEDVKLSSSPTAVRQMKDKVAILIPAYNEETVIRRTLASILKSRGVYATDVYLVSDGSTDDTVEAAESLGVNVLACKVNQGKAGAIRCAVAHFQLLTRYDYIALMDADTLVSEKYFKFVLYTFGSNPDVAAVCGRPKSIPYNWLTAYRALGYFMTHYVYRDAQSKMKVINVAPGCASSYRSDVFAKLDWNRDTLVEDMDVTMQVHRRNLGSIIYCGKAEVYTQDPRTIRDYAKQMNRWYTGTWQIARKYRILNSWGRVDLEFKLLMGEGALFSLWILVAPFLYQYSHRVAIGGIALDFAVMALSAAAVAMADKRWDVLYYSPFYPLVRLVDCSIFLTSLVRAIFNKRTLSWGHVKRYQIKGN